MGEKPTAGVGQRSVLEMASEIVSAYLRHNTLPSGRVPEFIHSVHKSLSEIDKGAVNSEDQAPKPAVPIRRSITPDHVICLEDGKKLKMLKRHLRATYNMSPDEYRTKWNLPPDYPMVAPNYAARRSEFAKKSGLGLKRTANQG